MNREEGTKIQPIMVLILAAGRGVRMGGTLPKALVPFEGRPLIQHAIDSALAVDPEKVVVVTGYEAEAVETEVVAYTHNNPKIEFVRQLEQRGTGHAALSAKSQLESFSGTVLVAYVDIPLLSAKSLKHLYEQHQQEKATVSLLSFFEDPPNQYGKIIRDPASGFVVKIVEDRDCSVPQRLQRECNSGVYCIDSAFAVPALEKLTPNNAQGELYLTDIVEIAVREGQHVVAVPAPDPRELAGVNTSADLLALMPVARAMRAEQLILSGVLIEDTATFYCEPEAKIAPGVRIGPNVTLKGKTVIEADVIIEGSAYLMDTTIQKGALIKYGVRTEGAVVGQSAAVGPFAHLRPGAVLGAHSKVGNFVELKNAHLRAGAKANHLAYLGDCSVGVDSNIGAGTIFCNYNGFEKHSSVVGDRVMIGSNSTLVAPVSIADDAYVAAGTVVKQSVPEDSLTFSKSEQVIRTGWTGGFRKRFSKGS